MSNIAIKVENLSKQYKIGIAKYRHNSLRDHLTEWAKSQFVRNGRHSPSSFQPSSVSVQPTPVEGRLDTFWALKDISFEIKQGETVGFIGKNGAGKSTLLKLLSRITQPTRGYAEIHGRVGSLLEVGTGFHPELTGRENIYLNGAILGMKKAEIARKFDEIVDFSGIEKFLETPVKRYSSGMYTRLAFSVAAHLDPEILIVDEVLAVGDSEFQRKCLDKMEDVGNEGRTVLFVSHNMLAVTRLCKRAILLQGGRVVEDGSPHQVVSAYAHSETRIMAIREWPDPSKAPSGKIARLRAVRVRTEDGRVTDGADIRERVGVEMEYDVLQSGYVLMPCLHFFNEEGIYVFPTHEFDPAWRGRNRPAGRYVSTAWIPGNFLSEGRLFVDASIDTLNPVIHQFIVHKAVAFQVIDSIEGNSARVDWAGDIGGAVRPLLEWSTKFTQNSPEGEAPQLEERSGEEVL